MIFNMDKYFKNILLNWDWIFVTVIHIKEENLSLDEVKKRPLRCLLRVSPENDKETYHLY